MKSLYAEDGRPNSAGNMLTILITDDMGKLFDEYKDHGYSPREISHIMIHAITMRELLSYL